MKILVLGCGPAGLLVAHATAQHGVEFDIVSTKRPSHIAGAQYLHSPVSDITRAHPDGHIRFIHRGDKRGYAMKVYHDSRARTSWERFKPGRVPVWNLQMAYCSLWERYEQNIIDGYFDHKQLPLAAREYTAIFSTVPRKLLMPGGNYESERVIITNGSQPGCAPNTIIMDGTPEHGWYRTSYIFDHAYTEWPWTPELERDLDGVVIEKPLRAFAHNPYPDVLYLFGRYGQWKKGVLVDDAYHEAQRVLEKIA